MWKSNGVNKQSTRARRRTSALIHAEFFLTGVVTALLGPILPALRSHFGVSDAQAGTLFVAQFAGSSVGALFSQVRNRFSVILGLALIAAGVAVLPFTSWGWAHVAVALFGLGLGFAIPATNMYVASSSASNRAASLNFLNFVWGAGAATTPLSIVLLQHWVGFKGALLLIALAVAGVFLMFMVFPLPSPSAIKGRDHLPIHTTGASELPALFVFCCMLFLYVGVETTIGGWTAAYVRELHVQHTFLESLALFCFWSALLGGRAFAPLTLRLVPESPLYRISLLTAAIGILSLIASRSAGTATVSAFIVGAGLAPLFALIVTLLSHHTGARGYRVPGWVFSIGGMGGAALPWLAGVVTTRFGSLRYGLFVTLVSCLPLFLMHLLKASNPITATPRN